MTFIDDICNSIITKIAAKADRLVHLPKAKATIQSYINATPPGVPENAKDLMAGKGYDQALKDITEQYHGKDVSGLIFDETATFGQDSETGHKLLERMEADPDMSDEKLLKAIRFTRRMFPRSGKGPVNPELTEYLKASSGRPANREVTESLKEMRANQDVKDNLALGVFLENKRKNEQGRL